MALKRNERYPGRFNNPSAGQPQGGFKNRTSPSAQDASYLEADWANDWSGFFSSLLIGAGLTPDGTVDSVGASQYYTALSALFLKPSNALSEIAALGLQSTARNSLGLGSSSTLTAPTGMASSSGYIRIPALISGSTVNFYVQWKTIPIPAATSPNMATATSTWPVAFPNGTFAVLASLANNSTYITESPGSGIVSAYSTSNSQFVAASGYTRSTSTVTVLGIGN